MSRSVAVKVLAHACVIFVMLMLLALHRVAVKILAHACVIFVMLMLLALHRVAVKLLAHACVIFVMPRVNYLIFTLYSDALLKIHRVCTWYALITDCEVHRYTTGGTQGVYLVYTAY